MTPEERRIRELELELELAEAEEAEAQQAPLSGIEKLAQQDAAAMRAPSKTQSLLHGAGSGFTLGWDDEINAAVQTMGHLVERDVSMLPPGVRALIPDEALRSAVDQPVNLSLGDRFRFAADKYRQSRDGFRREDTEARAANPGTFLAGEVVAAMTLPMGGQAKGLEGLKQASKSGAAYGGAAGLGSSEADLTKGEFGQAGLDWLRGTAIGSVAGPVGSMIGTGLGNGVGWVGRKLKGFGLDQAKKVLTNGADSLSRRTEIQDDVAREALETGAILPMGSTKGTHQRLTAQSETTGKVYAEILKELERLGVKGPRAQAIADEFMAKSSADFLASGADKSVATRYAKEALNASQVAPGDNLGLQQAELIKRRLQAEAADEYGKVGGSKPLGDAKKESASVYRQAIEDVVQQASDANPGTEIQHLGDSFKPIKDRLSRLIEARNAAERGAARGAQRQPSYIPGPLEGTAAMMTGNAAPLMMKPAAAILKNRLPSTMALGSYLGGEASQIVGSALRKPTGNAAVRQLTSGYERSEEEEQVQAIIDWLRNGAPSP